MYTQFDEFKSGKALREAVKSGRQISVWQPGPFGPEVKDGVGVVEGPQYPKPHRFYVKVEVKDGIIVKTLK